MPLVSSRYRSPKLTQPLMRAMLSGDGATFETLYRKYQAAVYRFALLRPFRRYGLRHRPERVHGLDDRGIEVDRVSGGFAGATHGVARNFLLKRDEAGAGLYLLRARIWTRNFGMQTPRRRRWSVCAGQRAAENVRAALAAPRITAMWPSSTKCTICPTWKSRAGLQYRYRHRCVRVYRARTKLVAMLMLEKETRSQ